MPRLSVIVAVLCVIGLTRSTHGQAFFGPGVVAFNPEISTVSTGTLVDAQAVVSYDRKYVTLNMQAEQSNLLALRAFQVSAAANNVGPAQGFVGGVNPGGVNPGGVNAGGANPRGTNAGGIATPPAAQMPSSSPDEIDRRAIASRSILQQRGMFLLRANSNLPFLRLDFDDSGQCTVGRIE